MITAIYLWVRKGQIDEGMLIAAVVDIAFIIGTGLTIYHSLLLFAPSPPC